MENIKRWTRERAQLRRVFTRHEELEDSADVEFLEQKMHRMFELDKSIQEEMLSAENFEDEAYSAECEQADTWHQRWLRLRKCYVSKQSCTAPPQVVQSRQNNLNLPKLELRRFDDNPKNWLSFWGQYKKIHEDGGMDAETKFQYLTQAMAVGSKARSLVESYPPTEENYKKVVDTLKSRFAKDETLIEIYVRELLQLVTKKDNYTIDILYDKITTNLQILESLGISKEKYECILLPLIESSLPESTLLSWSKIPHIGGSKLTRLIEFLQNEVEAEQRVQMVRCEFLEGTTRASPATAACLLSETKVKEKHDSQTVTGKQSCLFCYKAHNTLECGNANALSLEQKKDAIKKNGGCYICLKKGHLAKKCKAYIKCMSCSRRHLIVLCPSLHPEPGSSKMEKKEVVNNLSSNTDLYSTTLLQTVVVKISGNEREKEVRALLDSGSQRTYIKAALAEELGLQVTGQENLTHSLFGGVKGTSRTHRNFSFQVSNLDQTYITTMSGLEQEIICGGNIPKLNDRHLIKNLQKQQIKLSDATAKDIKEVGILIGSDQLGKILDNKIVSITEKLVAVKTKLGWTLQGPVQAGVCSNVVHSCFSSSMPETENSLEFLWNMETLGIKDSCSKQELIDTYFDISVDKEGRYEVPLLWKEGYPKVDSNYSAARSRLNSTTAKLSSTGRLNDYHNIIKDWERDGIIELADSDNEKEGHYLPHHAVIKLDSTTTKIRPVMDASSKDQKGLSLNMCIEKGANLIEMIPKLIMLFRARKYGVLGDIRKAFLQISVAPEDREFLKLLWWKDPNTKDEVVTYQHARVPFGVACSPFLLASTINHHLEEYKGLYPETAMTLKKSFYVDNCVIRCDTKSEATSFIKQATELMQKGKFELTGWTVGPEPEGGTVSVLGMEWDRTTDELYCNLNLKTVLEHITKRDLLSIAQQIFDTIGYLSPVSLTPRLIIQKTWMAKTGWDEKIPIELEKEYKEWVQTIDCLRECRIPRRLTEFPIQQCQVTVHIFCDASKDAYAGCVFLRTEHQGQVTVRLIVGKSRVSPIKRQNMSLPRLELMGALIASRLYQEVLSSELLSACKSYKTYCWTDSAIVLAWIQRQETWKTFVTNRITEISKNTNKEDWRHVPGVFNIADLPSRGCNAKTLLETRWWLGPQWLYEKEENWPKSSVNYTKADEENIRREQNKTTSVNVEINTETFYDKLQKFRQYSKIVRLVARLMRLSPRIRQSYNINSFNISFEEYQNAEKTLTKLIQRETYTDKKKLDKKFITTEEEGIMRVKTRIQYSGENKDFIYPILLPGNNEIVYRMVQETHKKMGHAGTQTLMATLRDTYWITGVRKVVKKVVAKCIICKRYKAKHYTVPEPPLPADRIKTAACFEVTGLDLAGPLFLKNNAKCWIVLYTCAVYRCIHLELCDSLSTNSLLMAMRRFIARRGRPRIIYRNNGTNMVGASNLIQEVQWREIEEATSFYRITWKFSVPAAPWWGGWWERLVRVVKDMLRRILGRASVDWVELSTILCDCETVINSRPLTYVEMGDTKPLTPMSFLQTLPSGETPDLDQIDQKSLQVRYKYLQQLREDFRKRFKKEYLSLLISKGREKKTEPQVGELVLIETDKSRLHWPVGIIKEIFTGRDGCTRAARVATVSGEKVRAYQRLYPLELSAVTQEWLNATPVSRDRGSATLTQDSSTTESQEVELPSSSSVPVPVVVPTTRSGRTIKLPSKFLD